MIESFSKVVEWLDLQENIEGDSFFSDLATQTCRRSSPFSIIPAFAGMTNGDESRETWAEDLEKGAT